MQGSEEWQSFFCEPFICYGSQPGCGRSEWRKGVIQNPGQQIIPTWLLGVKDLPLYNQVLLTLEWKIFGMSAILYSLTPPPGINQELTLINKIIIKTLFSHPLWCHVGEDVFIWGLKKHRWSQPRYWVILLLAMVPLKHPVRKTLGFRLCVPTPIVKNVVFLLRLFHFCNPTFKSLWITLEFCTPNSVSLCW